MKNTSVLGLQMHLSPRNGFVRACPLLFNTRRAAGGHRAELLRVAAYNLLSAVTAFRLKNISSCLRSDIIGLTGTRLWHYHAWEGMRASRWRDTNDTLSFDGDTATDISPTHEQVCLSC